MVQAAVTDDVFYALSNSTRRKVLEQLSVGPATVSELAAPFDMKLPSFVQHLAVLENSRLVKSKKRGRVRTYEIAPDRLKVRRPYRKRGGSRRELCATPKSIVASCEQDQSFGPVPDVWDR